MTFESLIILSLARDLHDISSKILFPPDSLIISETHSIAVMIGESHSSK